MLAQRALAGELVDCAELLGFACRHIDLGANDDRVSESNGVLRVSCLIAVPIGVIGVI